LKRSRDAAVNSDERIVKVAVTRKKQRKTFYAIHDQYLDYWRSTERIDDDRAWTRDLSLRAEFPSREEAGKELQAIWEYRRQQAGVASVPKPLSGARR
jgi:hypothetical protein